MTMKILAFDISGFSCSIALGDIKSGQYDITSHFHAEMAFGQAHMLLPEIQRMLEEKNISVKDLDGIAVTRGPGSFTGIRAQLAAAKGLALAHTVPVFGVDNFSVYAHKARMSGEPLLVALETKRRDLYVQLFSDPNTPIWGEGDSLEAESLAQKIMKENIQDIRVVGDGQDHLSTVKGFSIDKNVCSIKAQDILSYVAHIGVQRFSKNLDLLKPLYLRPALVQ